MTCRFAAGKKIIICSRKLGNVRECDKLKMIRSLELKVNKEQSSPWTRVALLVSDVNDDVTGIDDVRVVVKDQDRFPLRLLVKLLDQLLLGRQGGGK